MIVTDSSDDDPVVLNYIDINFLQNYNAIIITQLADG